jgi:hypothetical protein
MILEDLEHIFKPQFTEGTTKLYFMLIDNNHVMIERHLSDDLAGLLTMLDSFQYAGSEGSIPRFKK